MKSFKLFAICAVGVIATVFTLIFVLHKSPPPPPPKQLTHQERLDKRLMAAIYRGDKKGVEAALQAGASPNARGYWDWRGYWDETRKQRVWEPSRNTGGPTAMMLAMLTDDAAGIVELLIRAGGDVNAREIGGSSALIVAGTYGCVEASHLLLDHGADVKANKEGEDPLWNVTLSGNKHLAYRMIKRGAKVNYKNPDGRTPLHNAASCSYPSMIRLLLHHGADPNTVDHEGNTPLHELLMSGQDHHSIKVNPEERIASVRVILEYKPDLSLSNKQGKTALQIAQERSLDEVADLLIKAVAMQ